MASVAAVVVAFLAIAIASSVVFALDPNNPTNTTATSGVISGPSLSTAGVRVVKDNVTATGPIAATIVCEVFLSGCPQLPTSISNNQLIFYHGSYYFVHDFAIPTNPGQTTTTTSTGQDGRVTTTLIAPTYQSSVPMTIWFTNSTVYCISPPTWPDGNPWGVSALSCP